MTRSDRLRIGIVGLGRMGLAVRERASVAGHDVARIASRDAAATGAERPEDWGGKVDVAIEFSVASALETNLSSLLNAGIPVVSGTTGAPDAVERSARLAADRGVPMLWAPNFALGVQLVFRVTRLASRWLGKLGDFEPYVEERHHSGKADAPSGTARRLAQIVVDETPGKSRFGFAPESAPLPEDCLSVGVVRAGGNPGEHAVGWDGPLEEIRLTHRARDRSIFADGAVRAAEWIVTQDGPRTIDDLLDAMIDRTRDVRTESDA